MAQPNTKHPPLRSRYTRPIRSECCLSSRHHRTGPRRQYGAGISCSCNPSAARRGAEPAHRARREGTPVHPVREDRLRMQRVEQIDAVNPVVVQVEHDEPGTGENAGRIKNRLSGTPVHWPIAVQPSSHVWRVTCVRGGSPFNWSSVNDRGAATRPSTDNRQSRERSAVQLPVRGSECRLFGLRRGWSCRWPETT